MRIETLAETGRHEEAIHHYESLDSPDLPESAAHAVVDACRELGRTELALEVVDGRLARLETEDPDGEAGEQEQEQESLGTPSPSLAANDKEPKLAGEKEKDKEKARGPEGFWTEAKPKPEGRAAQVGAANQKEKELRHLDAHSVRQEQEEEVPSPLVTWRIRKAQLLLDKAATEEAAAFLDTFPVEGRDHPDWLDLRITAAWETGDSLAQLRYSQEKFEQQESPDPDLLLRQVNLLVALRAAHAAERLLREHRDLLPGFDEVALTDALCAVELHWSGFASPTLEERIERADRVIERIARHGSGPALPPELAHLRVVALRNATRWKESVAEYHRIEESGEAPLWVTAAAASSYLSLREPERARDLFRKVDDGGALGEPGVDGLFYALVEVEDFLAAYEWIDRHEADAPYHRQISRTGDTAENWRKLDLRRMAVNARHYGDQLAWAWSEVEGLRHSAPAHQGILQDHASLAAARGWHHLASDEFRIALDRNPESAFSRQGLGQSRLALHDPPGAMRQIEELGDRHPGSPELDNLLRDWETYHLREIWTDFGIVHSDGPEISGLGIEHKGELYASPFGLPFTDARAHHWRPMLEWKAAHAEILEGESDLFYLGGGLQFRSPRWEFLVRGGHAEHERGGTDTGRFLGDWKPGDHWRLRGEYDTFSPGTPLRALWHGIEADRKALSLTYRWHESRELSVSAAQSDFTDGNDRQEYGAVLRQRLVDIPHLDVDGLLSGSHSRNSLGAEAPYFNPEEDFSLSLGFAADHILWRRYERAWLHHLHGDIGLYDQKHFGTGWTASLGYLHRWQINPRWDFSTGIAGGRRVYDGEPEPFLGGNLTLHGRF